MPYIPAKDRPVYAELIKSLSAQIPEDPKLRPGHLNYVLTMLLKTTYGEQMRYADHNEVIGVLSCVMQEFYRRSTAVYEDLKIQQEGDLENLK